MHFSVELVELLAVLLVCRLGETAVPGSQGFEEEEDEEEEDEQEDSFCYPFPSVVLEDKEILRFKNGSILHNGLLYPVGLHRVVGNRTRGCVCSLRTCIRKCCSQHAILDKGIRPSCKSLSSGKFAATLHLASNQVAPEIEKNGGIAKFFYVVVGRKCASEKSSFILEPDRYEEDAFSIEANGTLQTELMFQPSSYCLDWQENSDELVAVVCLRQEVLLTGDPEENQAVLHVGMIVSIPFLFATFLVYAVIPELKNLYGKTLMCYVACLVVAYTFLVLVNYKYFPPMSCSVVAFTIHFSFLASFFWLNVMCFDIWWTFGGFRSLQGSAKQRERKKFIIYSIYAWGCASLLTGVCIIMDYVPSVPKHFIRPQFGLITCWFTTDSAKAIYFYGPMSVTVLLNICLFVSTALKILRHKKDTAHQLKGSDSRRHDDNKQWFNLYLKLFIVMGINWSMEIISWLCKDTPAYLWYITDLTNTLQGLIIFLIFVCKEKIKRLLLKRFGFRGQDVRSRNSTRSAYHSSASRTTCTTAAPLQDKINPYVSDVPYRNKPAERAFDDSDCA